MIGEAIYTILSNDSALTAVVGTRIYPSDAPQETPNPCIVWEVESQDPEYTKDGAAPVVYTNLEVDIFVNDSPKQGWEIAALVKSALDQYSGTVSGEDIDLIQWEGTDDGGVDVERNEYQVSMGFRIRVK